MAKTLPLTATTLYAAGMCVVQQWVSCSCHQLLPALLSFLFLRHVASNGCSTYYNMSVATFMHNLQEHISRQIAGGPLQSICNICFAFHIKSICKFFVFLF